MYESAANELEVWSRSATSQLDAQLRERRRSFGRRLEAVDRIQQAASGLAERISEIEAGKEDLLQLESKFTDLTSKLVALPEVVSLASEPRITANE